MRALREQNQGYEVISIADFPATKYAASTKFRHSSLDLRYRKGMSLNKIRDAGFLGPVSKVIFDFGSRMPVGYFGNSFTSITYILDDFSESVKCCSIIVPKNEETERLLAQPRDKAITTKVVPPEENPLLRATMSVPVLVSSNLYEAPFGFIVIVTN